MTATQTIGTQLRNLQIEINTSEIHDEYGDEMYVTYFDHFGNKAEFGIYFTETDSWMAGWELLRQGGNFEMLNGYVIHTQSEEVEHSRRIYKRSDVYLKGNLIETFVSPRGHRNSSLGQARDFCQNNPLE
jgi:hypothetical protein